MHAIGDAAQLAGWLSIDAHRYEEARTYCQLAMSVADTNNDHNLRAYVLGVVSYTHLHAGNGAAALGVLPTGTDLAGSRAAPAIQSWIAEARAEAHAFDGDPRAGMRELAQAERLFDGVTRTSTPPWLGFFNADHHVIRLKGRCLVRLQRPREAASTLVNALNVLPETFVRERSGTLIDLAFAHLQMKEIEEACRVAAQAEMLARQTNSARNLRRLRDLLIELMPWTNVPCVKDLYRQFLIN
jgi:tetratricopeptide (TPR) repeat protein